MSTPPPRDPDSLREQLYVIVFGAETPAGKLFDVVLLWLIVLSLLAVMLESVESIGGPDAYQTAFVALEWVITILFTIEYGLRLYCAHSALRYARSFFGVIDLLALLPTYVSLVVAGTHSLVVIRMLRLLRVFRVLKLGRFLREAGVLMAAIRASTPKILVFLFGVLNAAVIVGSAMYILEGGESGFNNIPRSIYWAIVTMTTVGYGDIAPQTPAGQMLAALLMLIGYGVIAVPTGIVSAEIVHATQDPQEDGPVCENCGATSHQGDATFCRACGTALE